MGRCAVGPYYLPAARAARDRKWPAHGSRLRCCHCGLADHRAGRLLYRRLRGRLDLRRSWGGNHRGSIRGFRSAPGSSGWALGAILILAISLLGLGQLFGALGEVVNQLTHALSPNVGPRLSTEAAGGPALVAFFGLLLSGLTAALGGWLGKV